MQQSLRDFLQNECKQIGHRLEGLIKVLNENGIDNLDQVLDISEADLINFGVSKGLSKFISSNITSLKEKSKVAIISLNDDEEPVDFMELVRSQFISEEDDEYQNFFFRNFDEDHEMIDTSSKPDNNMLMISDKIQANENALFENLGKQWPNFEYGFTLFETFEDVSSEYKMNKIRLNEEAFIKWLMNEKEHNSLQVIGFYGDFYECLKQVSIFLDRNIEIDNIHVKEGIIALKNENRLALVYKAESNEVYNYEKGADSSSLVSTYIRYLIDVCETIVIAPPPNMKVNPDISSPFKVSANIGFKLTESAVEPDDQVILKEVPYVNKVKSPWEFKCMGSNDQSKFIYDVQIQSECNKIEYSYHYYASYIYGPP